jgi:predicted nuclease of predicted toxin-antitoxin system
VKLLLDENLSPRLLPRLLSLFGSLAHVRDIGLQRSEDKIIWEWAKLNGYIRKNAVRISEFDRDNAVGLLSLRFPAD